jgi:peptide/nickel transport system ATP-binding protein
VAIWRAVTEPLTAKHLTEKPSRLTRREIARKILQEVGLETVDLDAKPDRLSIGQCQRVAIARALLAKPALIVADEPTSALDASVSKTILRLLSKIAENGTGNRHRQPRRGGLEFALSPRAADARRRFVG